MRVITNESKEENKKKEESSLTLESQTSESDQFNKSLVNEIANELYGVNFYTSLGICFKTHGLCDIAKFYWKLAEKTMCIKGKIKEFLLMNEYCFCIPTIPEVSDCSEFKNAVDYENKRIEELYKLDEKAPCTVTKGLVSKLIKKHMFLKHLTTLAFNISKNSSDLLLIQQEISKLICDE